MTLRETWAAWYSGEHKPYALPQREKGHEELVQVLMCIHRSFHKDKLKCTYVGGLVSEAIHAWKPPLTQCWISASALRLKAGERKSLVKEHDPPVAFYRDQILHKRFLKVDEMRKFVKGMRVTLITNTEDKRLTKSIKKRTPWKLTGVKGTKERHCWKSIRPPDAYVECKIETVKYPNIEACPKKLRAKLYPKRRVIKTAGE